MKNELMKTIKNFKKDDGKYKSVPYMSSEAVVNAFKFARAIYPEEVKAC